MPIHTPRPLRVIIIGAGPSGLLMAYKLRRNFVNLEWMIYEKNPDVGGTWYENRYPGCRCDNPAHTYVWTFDQSPKFFETYSTAQEVREYFKSFQERYELVANTKLWHEVVSSVWSATDGIWQVRIKIRSTGQEIQDHCHVLINAGGFLNVVRWPNIPGISDYRGQLVHTAAWPTGLDLDGKHVALVGNGSSGVQVAPAILPIVSKLTMFIRNPVWVASMGSSHRAYSEAEQKRFSEQPEDLTLLRKWLEHNANQAFPTFLAQTDAQKKTRETLTRYMKEALQDHPQAHELIPEWPVGCRRLSPGHGYLDSIISPKTQIRVGDITKFTTTSIVSQKEKIDVDVVICATGFDTNFKPRFPIIAEGKSLDEEWEDKPQNYFGLATAGFPNYFTLLGPNSPLGNGPVLVGIEAQADYICKILNRIQCQNILSIVVTESAVKDFLAHKDRFMPSTVWGQGCRSWYKNHTTNGKVLALWPGSTLHYIEALQEVRYEDFDICYIGNRFAYLGDGLSRLEQHTDADLAPYIRSRDDGAILGSKFEYQKKPSGF